MSRLKTLFDRYAQARADVDVSNAEIRRASARRLAQLLAAADTNALVAGLSDAALTAYDRQQLEHAIADRLPKRRRRVPRAIGRAINLSLQRARYQARSVLVLSLVLALMAPFGFLALRNTGAQLVWFDQPWQFDCQFPDGHRETIEIAARAGVVAMPMSRADQVTLRVWDRRAGYGLTNGSASWFANYAHAWNGRPANAW